MARIKVVPYTEAAGSLKEIYDELKQKRGQLSEVLMVQSLHPPSIKSHVDLYMDIMFTKTALSRAEKEMIAVVVSVANGCLYCQTHHGAALANYWKDEDRVEQLKKDFMLAGLSERDRVICRFAVRLTKNASAHEHQDYTLELKAQNLMTRLF